MQEVAYCIHCGQRCLPTSEVSAGRCRPPGTCCVDPIGARGGEWNPPKGDPIQFNTHTGQEIPGWRRLLRAEAVRLAWVKDQLKVPPSLDPLVKLARDAHVEDHFVSRATAIYELVTCETDRNKAILRIASLLKAMTPGAIAEKERRLRETEEQLKGLAQKAMDERAMGSRAAVETRIRAQLEKFARTRKSGTLEANVEELRKVRELARAGAIAPDYAMEYLRDRGFVLDEPK